MISREHTRSSLQYGGRTRPSPCQSDRSISECRMERELLAPKAPQTIAEEKLLKGASGIHDGTLVSHLYAH